MDRLLRAGAVDGPATCRMFKHAVAGALTLPRHLSSDHDPLFEFHRWKANLRVLDVTEIKTVSEVPLSHPFIERLVGTIRRELLDQIPFWSAEDLERKLLPLILAEADYPAIYITGFAGRCGAAQ